MARMCVDINKIEVQKNSCFYEVDTNDEGGAHFFVKVDRDARRIDMYLNKSFETSFLSVDTNKDQKIEDIGGISKFILLRVIWRCMQTYDEVQFPDSLSFCS